MCGHESKVSQHICGFFLQLFPAVHVWVLLSICRQQTDVFRENWGGVRERRWGGEAAGVQAVWERVTQCWAVVLGGTANCKGVITELLEPGELGGWGRPREIMFSLSSGWQDKTFFQLAKINKFVISFKLRTRKSALHPPFIDV